MNLYITTLYKNSLGLLVRPTLFLFSVNGEIVVHECFISVKYLDLYQTKKENILYNFK